MGLTIYHSFLAGAALAASLLLAGEQIFPQRSVLNTALLAITGFEIATLVIDSCSGYPLFVPPATIGIGLLLLGAALSSRGGNQSEDE